MEPHLLEWIGLLVISMPWRLPQVSNSAGVSSQYPSNVFSPPLMADNSLTLLAAKSTQRSQADGVVVRNEERGAI